MFNSVIKKCQLAFLLTSYLTVTNVLLIFFAQDLSSRVVTRARVGFRARVTYFELGCPETNIDPEILCNDAILSDIRSLLTWRILHLRFNISDLTRENIKAWSL